MILDTWWWYFSRLCPRWNSWWEYWEGTERESCLRRVATWTDSHWKEEELGIFASNTFIRFILDSAGLSPPWSQKKLSYRLRWTFPHFDFGWERLCPQFEVRLIVLGSPLCTFKFGLFWPFDHSYKTKMCQVMLFNWWTFKVFCDQNRICGVSGVWEYNDEASAWGSYRCIWRITMKFHWTICVHFSQKTILINKPGITSSIMTADRPLNKDGENTAFNNLWWN